MDVQSKSDREVGRMRLSGFFLLVFGTLPLAAQVDRATINGTVSDTSGAVVPHAKIAVVAPSTGFRRETMAGATGAYTVPGLPIGAYDVIVSHTGFETVELKGLTL